MLLGFGPDGHLLVVACGRSRVTVWDLTSGTVLSYLYDSPTQAVACAFSPDGAKVAVGGFDGALRLSNPQTGEMIREIRGGLAAVWDLSFSPDGERLACADLRGGVTLWDAATSELLWLYRERYGYLSVDVGGLGESVAYGSLTNGAGLVDPASGARRPLAGADQSRRGHRDGCGRPPSRGRL